MKILLAILGGLTLALAMFGGGLIVATAFFQAEPERQLALNQNTAGVWTLNPEKVNPAQQQFERMPAQPLSPDQQAMVAKLRADLIDTTTTGSITPPAEDLDKTAQAVPPQLNPAHVAWCSERFRSYRAEDNSYTPYSGGRRACASPYSEEPFAQSGGLATASIQEDPAAAVESGAFGLEEPFQAATGSAHQEFCFAHYRSYRLEDNSYQSFGGGRRQCVSPFRGDDVAAEPTAAQADSFADASVSAAGLTAYADEVVYGESGHAQACFARYRSYRPEDNTYQPFGGGPRQQCE